MFDLLRLPWWQHQHIWTAFVREVGFAALIALLILLLVERASKSEQNRLTREFLKLISTDVLHATLGVPTNISIARSVITNILAAPVLRPRLDYTVVIDRLNVPSDRCVLNIMTSYQLRNVSNRPISWPIRIAIPRLIDETTAAVNKINSWRIGERSLSESEIQEAANRDDPSRIIYTHHYVLNANDTLSVAVSYTLLKHVEDVEILTLTIPTQDITITIDNQRDDLVWNIQSRLNALMQRIDVPREDPPWSRARAVFKIDEPILPYQGVTVWWTRKIGVDKPKETQAF